MIACDAAPTARGVYDTEQDATPVEVGDSVQDAAENAPDPSEANATEPDGVEAVPAPASDTVAEHDDATPTAAGEHDTAVVDERFVTVTLSEPELITCAPSPP